MPRAHRFRPAVIVTALLATLFAGLSTAAPAAAHDALVSSTPAEGEQLAAPPAQITLEFSNEVLAMGGAEVQVNDTTGRNWVTGEATVAGATVTATIAEGMPAGSYEVLWRVVSADGHPISAAIPFTVLEGATPSPTPSATPTTTATAVPSPTSTPTSTDNGSDATNSAPGPWPIIVISLVVIVLLIAGFLVLFARRRRAERADSEA